METPSQQKRRMPSYLIRTNKAIRMEKIYLTAGMFVSIGLGQMLFIRLINFDLSYRAPLPGLMWLVISLVCLFLLVTSELFNKNPINWTLGSVSVESMTMCVISYDWTYLSASQAAIVILTILLVTLVLYTLGAVLPVACLPGYRFMLVTTIVYIILYILLTIIVHSVRIDFLVILDSCSLLYMVVITFYGSTIIHHRRVEGVLSEEYVLSATIIATFFFYKTNLLTSVVTSGLALYQMQND